MQIVPKVVEQNKSINYVLSLRNINHIESIEILSKNDYFHINKIEYKIQDDKVLFTSTVPVIGEFILKVNLSFDNYKKSKLLTLYCLDKDMIKLKPFKGDLHMHSIYSDGNRTPLAMCLHSLGLGLDFMSLTDHDCYEGSLEAIAKVKESNIDILVLPGEEITVRKNETVNSHGNGHMLSINANKSIENQRLDSAIYAKELEDIAQNIKGDLIGKDIDPLDYARNVWAINKVHEANGIAIQCHPNWIYHNSKYHLNQPIYKELLASSLLDGVEVIGDINKTEENNNMGYMTYIEIKDKNKYLSPLANTDAHDIDHNARERFNIVFAKDKTAQSITNAIKDGLTCATLRRENDEHQFVGKSHLTHYAYFLVKEYFPKHKHLKHKLSQLYLDGFINNTSFEDKIRITKTRLKEHDNQFFSRQK